VQEDHIAIARSLQEILLTLFETPESLQGLRMMEIFFVSGPQAFVRGAHLKLWVCKDAAYLLGEGSLLVMRNQDIQDKALSIRQMLPRLTRYLG
jgi:hypothetical protein